MKFTPQKLNVPPLYIPVLLYIATFAMWMLIYFLDSSRELLLLTSTDHLAERILPTHTIWAHILSFAVMAVNSALIAQMNNKFSFIRTRTFIPTFIYLFISLSWIETHGNYLYYLATFFVLLALFLSLDSYKNRTAVEHHFLAFFLLAFASFFVPNFLFLLPFFWLGWFFLKTFSFRSFIASVLGFFTPWILYLGFNFVITGEVRQFKSMQKFFYSFELFDYTHIVSLVYMFSMMLVLLISLTQMFIHSRRDSLQARDQLNFLKMIGAGVLIVSLFRFSGVVAFLPLFAFFYAVLSAYAFTLVKSKFNSILFILFLLIGVLYIASYFFSL